MEIIFKKKKQNPGGSYVGAIAVFILAIIIGLVFFFVTAQRTIESSSQERMRNNVARQSEHLRAILNIHYSYLEGIAEKMGEGGDLLSEENMQMLTTFQESTALDRTALIQPNGDAHYDNGLVKNVAHRRYFKEGISGSRTLSDPLESSVDQETKVVLGVPVFHEETVIGVLGSSYNVGELSRMLFDDLFSGKGYSLIVTRDGEIIAHDGDATDYKLSYGDNIFEFYKFKKIGQGHSIEEISQDFNEGKEGLIRLRGYADSSDRYLAYAPLGINDWMICYVAPVTVAQQSYAFVEQYEFIFLGCFGVQVCILIFYIIRKNRQKTEEILRSARTDELTQVYNRKYAESYTERILNENHGERQSAFFIMDVDKFKEMNLTKEKANLVQCPLIKESPVSIECKVEKIVDLGSHTMFMAKVLCIDADEQYIDEKGAFDISKCKLMAYANGGYYALGKKIGKFGFSVQKKKNKNKR